MGQVFLSTVTKGHPEFRYTSSSPFLACTPVSVNYAQLDIQASLSLVIGHGRCKQPRWGPQRSGLPACAPHSPLSLCVDLGCAISVSWWILLVSLVTWLTDSSLWGALGAVVSAGPSAVSGAVLEGV